MTKMTNMDIYLKKDYMQYTGSFKERGARYTLLMLSDEQKKKGVIAASAGNHALALAFHGGQLSKLNFLIRDEHFLLKTFLNFRYSCDCLHACGCTHHEGGEL